MSDHEFHEPRWTWLSKDNDTRVGYMGMDGRVSLDALIEHLRVVAPDALLGDVYLNYATVKWTRAATPEELAEREAAAARQAARQEEWERDTLARLIEKYGEKP